MLPYQKSISHRPCRISSAIKSHLLLLFLLLRLEQPCLAIIQPAVWSLFDARFQWLLVVCIETMLSSKLTKNALHVIQGAQSTKGRQSEIRT